MKSLVLPVISLLAVLNGFAQKDTVRKWLDADLHFTNKKNFVYAAMAIRDNDRWTLYAVYPDTSVLLKVSFKDAALSVKDGFFELYHPKKILAQKGTFTNNVANGHWQTWYADGQLKNEGLIVNNHLSGVWKHWYENGQLMREQNYLYKQEDEGAATHQHLPSYKVEKILGDFDPEGQQEGRSTTWYRNGNKESEVNYHNDSLAGVCRWFRENGNPSSTETYTDGKVTDLECFDEDGKNTGSTCSILKLPLLIHPFFDALDYIEYELHKEKHKAVQEGDADISFLVTQKGQVEKLEITRSPDPELNKLLAQIIKTMPAWSPAVVHNRAVDYPVKLTVPYYRD